MKWLRRLRWILPICALLLILPMAAQMNPQTEATEEPEALFPPDVLANLDLIFAEGQARGNRPTVFSKVGDSISASVSFFTPIGEGNYDLADYAYLQPVIDYYSADIARTGNSFSNSSLAAGVGWAAGAVLDARFASTAFCGPRELPLKCEFRLARPAVAIILFGTNDASYVTPEHYRYNMERIINATIDNGVIPVVSTVPVRVGYEGKIALYNAMLMDLTARYHLPLWDYAATMELLPDRGIAWDGIHPSAPGDKFHDTANFQPWMLHYGYTQRNLTGLQMLYKMWQYLQTKL